MLNVLFYIGSIVIANLLVQFFGIISFAGLSFPAGALMIGFSFTLRDLVQKTYGKYWCWVWMLFGLLITIWFSKEIALASGIAFLVAETIDWLIFTFSKLKFKKRILVSNIISIPFDSLIFIPMIFGWVWSVIIGQIIIKILFSLLVIPLIKDEI